MKKLAVSILIACAAGAGLGGAAQTRNSAQSPVLVELFTSEGCSSCPPADALLEQMDAAQPVPGAQLIVLNEHIDYFNHGGWKDPYSSALLTRRQDAYVRAFGLASPYTPQIIVDGASDLEGKGWKDDGVIFLNAAAAHKAPIHVGPARVEAGPPAVLRAHVEIDGSAETHDADIYAAVALNHAESQVLGGENKGRRLTYVAVVENLEKIGKLEKGKSFNQDFQVKLKPGADPKNLRLIVFAQESGPGQVIGAALQKDIH